MDWTLAITKNREALLRVVAGLYAMAGFAVGASFAVLPRFAYRAMLRILRPAESAARRLIFIAAQGMPLPKLGHRVAFTKHIERGLAPGRATFPLIEPLKCFPNYHQKPSVDAHPRISVPGICDPVFATSAFCANEAPISCARLSRRIEALVRALENINTEARRLARWTARRDAALQELPRQPRRYSPFRPGSPPGMRRRRGREVDLILRECHLLMLDMRADTS